MVRAAGLIIYRRLATTIEFLLLQTSYGEHHWTPPKGHVDPGEDDLTTAKRETEEEAGLVESDYLVEKSSRQEIEYPVNGRAKQVVYWSACVNDANVTVRLSHEHQAYRWCNLAEALDLVSHTTTIALLRKAHSMVPSNIAK